MFVANGTAREQIHNFDTEGYRLSPAGWSPDGLWILLIYHEPEGNPELWILSRDGSHAGTLADHVWPQGASWRIDGVGTFPELVPVGGAQ